MNSSSDNLLGFLRGLSARPQNAGAGLKLLGLGSDDWEQGTRALSEHTAEVLKATQAHQAAAAALRLYDQELRVTAPQLQTLTSRLTRTQQQSQLAVVPVKQMQDAFRELGPEISAVTAETEQHSNAAQRAARALQAQTTAGVELMGRGLAGIIAGRKAQAGVEAVWETARGIALLAEGTWPPNPAAIVAAGLHFEAAAQYALLAGTSSQRHGGGTSGGTASGGSGAYNSSVTSYGSPAQTLAPGAAAPSSRFGSGVVIIRGTQAFEEYVAGAVNGAVARGVTVTATQSQRGAPVGH